MLKQRSWVAIVEWMLLIAGVILIGFYAAARIHSIIAFRSALHTLNAPQPAEHAGNRAAAMPMLPLDSSMTPDQSSWSEERIRAYQKSTLRQRGTPLAILRIPKLQLEVPVLEGTDPITLNGGAGRIPGTALPGQWGNIGIAGHRDGFFRSLKDIAVGDRIQLVTNQRTDTYVVEKIHITIPQDVSVLGPSRRSELTLVTCYPFYFVGSAPKRFIVQASLKQ